MRARKIQYHLEICDSIFDPYDEVQEGKKRKAYYRKMEDGTFMYKVWLYVDGPDLPFVERVTYVLHPTFPKPERTVMSTPENPKAALSIWTWGVFEVKVEIEDIGGRVIGMPYQLRYDHELRGENVEWIEM